MVRSSSMPRRTPCVIAALLLVTPILGLCTTRECENTAEWFRYTYINPFGLHRGLCEVDHRSHFVQLVRDHCAHEPTSQWSVSCFSCTPRVKFCGAAECGGPHAGTCMPPTADVSTYHCECRLGFVFVDESESCEPEA